MKKIRVFTTKMCPFCVVLKQFLKERNLEFEEIDVSDDEKGIEELFKKSGQYGVPVVEINGKIIIGFNQKEILKSLE